MAETKSTSQEVNPRLGLKQSDRLDSITEMVLSLGSMRIDELVDLFGVSIMTIHRDLDELDTKGLLRKSRGMVTAVSTSLFEASTEYRVRQSRVEKSAVAKVAFDYIDPGQAVILDDSTTGLVLAEMLVDKRPLTVITNFQRMINVLKDQPGINLISTGGQYYQWCEAFMGTVALAGLRSLRADVVIMSSPAVTNGVCYHQHHDAVLMKQAMFEAANTKILYFDHSKLEKRALHAHLKVSDFDIVIVDSNTSEEQRDHLREAGANLVIAQI
ncbi:MAG: DeoR/GlpR transcriptional regulator [Actinomycetales bacterium]|nr:DeoR/GlpR transcriptional regulator [Actinomycetales bacterium]